MLTFSLNSPLETPIHRESLDNALKTTKGMVWRFIDVNTGTKTDCESFGMLLEIVKEDFSITPDLITTIKLNLLSKRRFEGKVFNHEEGMEQGIILEEILEGTE